MEKGIRWRQEFENLGKAMGRLREALQATSKEPHNYSYQIALIHMFQLTFELSWKTMKDYLACNGVHVSLPREVIQRAFQHQLIQDERVWIDVLKRGDLLANAYDEQAATLARKRICEEYAPAIEQLHKKLLENMTDETRATI